MNLIQIKERLESLPQTPETMEWLIKYANNFNPREVPAYVALAEIERRNKEKSSEPVAAPQGTVKERSEAEAMKQASNLMAAQGAQQQQGIQQLQSALSQGQGEVAPGTPQPQNEQIPMQAADGGIMRLPVDHDMFNFDSGGIVAFAGGDVVDYKAKAAEYFNKQPDIPKTYMETMEEAKLKNPELAKPAGQATERQIQELQAQDAANRAKFDEREQARRRQDFWNQLIAAGEASRGMGGISAVLGGYGKAAGANQAAADERRARQEALQREYQMNILKLNAEIENLRRAEARGDVAEQQKSIAKISEIKNATDKAKAELGVNLGQLSVQEAQQEEAKRHNIAAENLQGQQIKQMGSAYKPQVIQMAEYLRGKYPNLSEQELLDMAAKYTNQGIAGGARMDASTMEALRKIEDKYRMQLQIYANDPKKLAEIQAQKDAEIKNVTGGIASLPQPGTQPTQQGTGAWGKAERIGS
jgi:hypothetical protein